MSSLLSRWRGPVRFGLLMVLAYGGWYLLYELWLLPAGHLDAWVAHRVSRASYHLLTILGLDAFHAGRVVGMAGRAGVEVSDACNGLASIGLFIGFVCAYPGRMGRRLLFLPAGVLTLCIANIFRVASLALVQQGDPVVFARVHDLVAQNFFYVVIFALWLLWMQVGAGVSRCRKAPPEPVPA